VTPGNDVVGDPKMGGGVGPKMGGGDGPGPAVDEGDDDGWLVVEPNTVVVELDSVVVVV
jgi:hypothetical protein